MNVKPIFSGIDFNCWYSLNDTIMGGSSTASCGISSEGLILTGNVIEAGGGFVSCRSPLLNPCLDLSKFKSLRLEIEGDGRTFKLAVCCRHRMIGFSDLLSKGISWIAEFPTSYSGITIVDIPFQSLLPAVRARPIKLPFGFNSSAINKFQLLHSRFGISGELNTGFRSGPINIRLVSISAIN